MTTGSSLGVRPSSRLKLRWSRQLVLLGILAFAFAVATLDAFPVGAGGDDAMYLVLAKSLATGQGYHSINVPGSPPNTHFPPGYPAVLSVLWRVGPSFPHNVILFKAFNIVCFVAAAIGIARFAVVQGIGSRWAIGIGVLAAISVPSLVLVALVFSEPLFLCLIVLLLPAIERFVRVRPSERQATAYAAGLGLAIGCCTLVRSHGIVLVPALALLLAAQRRWRDIAITLAAFLVCFVPWQLWCATHTGIVPTPLLGEYDSYTAWWIRGFREMGPAMVPRTLVRTISDAASMFAALFSPTRGSIAHDVTFLALAALVLAGVAAAWRRIPVTLLFLAGYFIIVALWPFQPSRFIWGVWPLLLMVLVFGVRGATERRWPMPARATVMLAGLWACVGYAAYEGRAIRGRWWSTIPRNAAPHISFAVGWARSRTAPDDVIATEDDGAVFLYTGRPTVPVRPLTPQQYLEDATPEEDAASGLLPIMAAYPVRTVIVHTSDRYLTAMHLSSLPSPRLVPQASTPGGAAFAVLAP
ncbi:MAG: hypothetical protein M3Z05_19630 [Gemmatimonadota bacterium]|nr:hypothetical protein [Gemmatimonadota bacterium]